MKKLFWIIIALIWSWILIYTFLPVKWYPRINGYIHNPRYGRYPEQVMFETGMTIYPGQSAILGMPCEIVEDDEGPTLKWGTE